MFKALLAKLVHRYILVDKDSSDITTQSQALCQLASSNVENQCNPHANRIAAEHNYAMTHQSRIVSVRCYTYEIPCKEKAK